jgi:hypothetical protein
MQAELGTPPQDVGRIGGPFVAQQVVHLGGIEPAQDFFSHLFQALLSFQQRVRAAAVGARIALQ